MSTAKPLWLSLPTKIGVRITDHPDMTSAVYCGCKRNQIKTYQKDRYDVNLIILEDN